MREFKDWSYFTYDVGRYLPWGWEWNNPEKNRDFKPYKPNSVNTTEKKLAWYVFNEEPRGTGGKIVPVNIFEYNWVFLVDLLNIKKKYKDDFVKFADATRSALQHQYWSRSEYETIITTWPPYIDGKELDRLNKERDECLANDYKFYREGVNLERGVKIDIYDQIMLNWDVFIKYLWDNKHLITAKKLGIEDILEDRKRRHK